MTVASVRMIHTRFRIGSQSECGILQEAAGFEVWWNIASVRFAWNRTNATTIVNEQRGRNWTGLTPIGDLVAVDRHGLHPRACLLRTPATISSLFPAASSSNR